MTIALHSSILTTAPPYDSHGWPVRLVFAIPDRLTEGGMPDDLRMFVSGVRSQHSGSVSLLTRGQPADPRNLLNGVEVVDASATRNAEDLLVRSLHAEDICVFFTFSNLLNVRLARQLSKLGLRYTVVPAWQVHPFLDWDNPFEKNALPTVSRSETNPNAFRSGGHGRVLEGRKTPRAALRAVLRAAYRRSLGRTFLSNASAIHVFSDHERRCIERLVGARDATFLPIRFGTTLGSRPAGPDTFPLTPHANIVYWGRADYYYKGLDLIVDAIAAARTRGIAQEFTFWVIGPDYNDGYGKLRAHAARLGVAEYVRILAPGQYTRGTDALLRKADFCIMASRWDGYARTLREAACLGVPILTNSETHFDTLLKRFDNGMLFQDKLALAGILASLNSPEVRRVVHNAKAARYSCADFLSWPAAAASFLDSLRGVEVSA